MWSQAARDASLEKREEEAKGAQQQPQAAAHQSAVDKIGQPFETARADLAPMTHFRGDQAPYVGEIHSDYQAMRNGQMIGHAEVLQTGPMTARVETVKVDPAEHGRGIASALYDRIEGELNRRGVVLQPSTQQTNSGQAFWKNRLANPTPREQETTRLRSYVMSLAAKHGIPTEHL